MEASMRVLVFSEVESCLSTLFVICEGRGLLLMFSGRDWDVSTSGWSFSRQRSDRLPPDEYVDHRLNDSPRLRQAACLSTDTTPMGSGAWGQYTHESHLIQDMQPLCWNFFRTSTTTLRHSWWLLRILPCNCRYCDATLFRSCLLRPIGL